MKWIGASLILAILGTTLLYLIEQIVGAGLTFIVAMLITALVSSYIFIKILVESWR